MGPLGAVAMGPWNGALSFGHRSRDAARGMSLDAAPHGPVALAIPRRPRNRYIRAARPLPPSCMFTLQILDSGQPFLFPLGERVVVLGRDERADLVLHEPGVATRHLRLVPSSG